MNISSEIRGFMLGKAVAKRDGMTKRTAGRAVWLLMWMTACGPGILPGDVIPQTPVAPGARQEAEPWQQSPKPVDNTAPAAEVTGRTTSTLTMKWTKPVQPHGTIVAYRVGWDTTSATAPVKTWTGTYPNPANPYTFTNLAPDTVYTLRIEAIDDQGVAGGMTSLAQKTDGTAAPQVPSGNLPTRVVGGYWQNWGAPNIALGDVPSEYNVIYLSFALGVNTSSGTVQWEQYVQSDASFRADMKKIQAQGRKVILSIGGWFDLPNQNYGFRLGPDNRDTRVSQFVQSVKALQASYGFDGIDWDLEHGIDVAGLVAASNQLKAAFGPNFLVTAAPMPANSDYTRLALELGSNIDFIAPMYYDQNLSESASRAQIVNKTRELVNAGIPASKVGIGTRSVGNSGSLADNANVITIGTIQSVWNELKGSYPTLRGSYAWSINLDQTVGYAFATQAGVTIRQ